MDHGLYGGLQKALSGGLMQSAQTQSQYLEEYARKAQYQALAMQQANATHAKPKEQEINPVLLLTGDEE